MSVSGRLYYVEQACVVKYANVVAACRDLTGCPNFVSWRNRQIVGGEDSLFLRQGLTQTKQNDNQSKTQGLGNALFRTAPDSALPDPDDDGDDVRRSGVILGGHSAIDGNGERAGHSAPPGQEVARGDDVLVGVVGGCYRKFVEHILQLASAAKIVNRTRHKGIQKMVGTPSIKLLFLD